MIAFLFFAVRNQIPSVVLVCAPVRTGEKAEGLSQFPLFSSATLDYVFIYLFIELYLLSICVFLCDTQMCRKVIYAHLILDHQRVFK